MITHRVYFSSSCNTPSLIETPWKCLQSALLKHVCKTSQGKMANDTASELKCTSFNPNDCKTHPPQYSHFSLTVALDTWTKEPVHPLSYGCSAWDRISGKTGESTRTPQKHLSIHQPRTQGHGMVNMSFSNTLRVGYTSHFIHELHLLELALKPVSTNTA